VVAEAWGEQTLTTMFATSSTLARRLVSEVERWVAMNCFSSASAAEPWSLASLAKKSTMPSDRAGPGGTAFTVNAGASDGFREAARDRELRRLGHAIINHLDGDVEPECTASRGTHEYDRNSLEGERGTPTFSTALKSSTTSFATRASLPI
jgi:hypothetical protein